MFHSAIVGGQRKVYLNDASNDLWIREVVFPGKRGGYFVEAGAGDGMTGSSCFMLERHLDWTGLCIEPFDPSFEQLGRRRPRSAHENVCLAASWGAVEFMALEEAGGCFSGVKDALLRNKTGGEEIVERSKMVVKQAAPLADLLRKHGAPATIEYGAFDMEGSEYEVFRTFPFDEYRFLAMSFELDGKISRQMVSLLSGKGYRETKNPFNTEYPWERYFLHQDFSPPAA